MNSHWFPFLPPQWVACHRRPDRSFFYHGRQFIVCARCTGVYLGNALALALWWHYPPKISIRLFCCGIMLLDWGMQHLGLLESTNLRRLLTGLLCGYGLFSIQLLVLSQVGQLFVGLTSNFG